MKSLSHSETSTIIQAEVEGLDPQQLLARDLLVDKGLLSRDHATSYVKEIGGTTAAVLKEALQKAQSPAEAFIAFRQSLAALVTLEN